ESELFGETNGIREPLGVYPRLFWDPDLRRRGLYCFRFCKYGQWLYVIVDDRLPFAQGTSQPLFAQAFGSSAEGCPQLWAALLEKACAKLHGAYSALWLGFVDDALEDLTSWPTEKTQVSKYAARLVEAEGVGRSLAAPAKDPQELWSSLRADLQDGSALNCSRADSGGNPGSSQTTGLDELVHLEPELLGLQPNNGRPFCTGVLRNSAYAVLCMEEVASRSHLVVACDSSGSGAVQELLITFRDADNDECIFNETNFQDSLTCTSEEKIWFTVHLPWADRFELSHTSVSNGNGHPRVGVFWGIGHRFNISEPLTGAQQTNQRAELFAVIRALIGRRSVSNMDLWQRLDALIAARRPDNICVLKLKGHAKARDILSGATTAQDRPGNDAADELAVAGAAMHAISPEGRRSATQATLLASRVQHTMLSILLARNARQQQPTRGDSGDSSHSEPSSSSSSSSSSDDGSIFVESSSSDDENTEKSDGNFHGLLCLGSGSAVSTVIRFAPFESSPPQPHNVGNITPNPTMMSEALLAGDEQLFPDGEPCNDGDDLGATEGDDLGGGFASAEGSREAVEPMYAVGQALQVLKAESTYAPCTIVAADKTEMGPMYAVRFEDGQIQSLVPEHELME
ncbi:unnamed protein product, partial [Polarella glacialis]